MTGHDIGIPRDLERPGGGPSNPRADAHVAATSGTPRRPATISTELEVALVVGYEPGLGSVIWRES
jgi:hypothetical protein